MPRLFTAEELATMDSLTANNPVVLASLGGKPTMPEDILKAKEATTAETPSSEPSDAAQRPVGVDEEEKAQLDTGGQPYRRQTTGRLA